MFLTKILNLTFFNWVNGMDCTISKIKISMEVF